MQAGDLAVHSKISFKSESTSKLFSKTEYVLIEIESTVSEGSGTMPEEQIKDEFKLQLGNHLPLRSLMTSQETREAIEPLLLWQQMC